MRVVTQQTFGPPEVLHLEEREPPDPLPTEIRVRVAAAGVNPVDWKTRAGRGMSAVLGPPPFVLGWDVAGAVDAVGLGVTRFSVGDRVFGMPWFPREAGAYGELVTAPSRHFAPVPAGIDDLGAGALPLASLTAWQALVDTAGLRAGQHVLVHAAAGGVGHLAVQIAKAHGAFVVGTGRAAGHEFLASIGADRSVDYETERFEEVVSGMDVVLDLVGGEYSIRSLQVLRPGGILVSVPSGLPGGLAEEAAARSVRATGFLVEPDHTSLERIAALVGDGALAVEVSRSYPLDEAWRAHHEGEGGHTRGKLVLSI